MLKMKDLNEKISRGEKICFQKTAIFDNIE